MRTDDVAALFACHRRHNSGDTVFLRDDQGDIVVSQSYRNSG